MGNSRTATTNVLNPYDLITLRQQMCLFPRANKHTCYGNVIIPLGNIRISLGQHYQFTIRISLGQHYQLTIRISLGHHYQLTCVHPPSDVCVLRTAGLHLPSTRPHASKSRGPHIYLPRRSESHTPRLPWYQKWLSPGKGQLPVNSSHYEINMVNRINDKMQLIWRECRAQLRFPASDFRVPI